MFALELTTEEAVILAKMLTNKAKELHAWRIALNSTLRDTEYKEITDLLKKLSYGKKG